MSTFADDYGWERKIRSDLDAGEGQEALHSLLDSINAKGTLYSRLYRAYSVLNKSPK